VELCYLLESKGVSPDLISKKENLDFVKPEYETRESILMKLGKKFSIYLMLIGKN
jgi:hypothetical protein